MKPEYNLVKRSLCNTWTLPKEGLPFLSNQVLTVSCLYLYIKLLLCKAIEISISARGELSTETTWPPRLWNNATQYTEQKQSGGKNIKLSQVQASNLHYSYNLVNTPCHFHNQYLAVHFLDQGHYSKGLTWCIPLNWMICEFHFYQTWIQFSKKKLM